MKKSFLLFSFLIILSLFSVSFATENISVILNRQVKVTYNGAIQEFQNVKGERVYPISYEGTTYLPIRSISTLFKSAISWDGETNSVYLGDGELDSTSSRTVENFAAGENENITVLLNQDIKIYYNNEVQTFTDVNGKVVYPISYNGTTYLPVRAVSNLFGLEIDWDGENNTVIINEKLNETSSSGKILVAYFSAQNHTEAVANKIAELLNADVFEVVPVDEYTEEDLSYTSNNSRVAKEHDDEPLRDIELVSTSVENWEDYDTVLIGYPIWWGDAAWPINNFLKDNDFTGKTVIPFCTSASSGLGGSARTLEDLAGTGNWQEGHRFSSNASDSTIEEWVNSLNLK